jgi:hypothetical protein
LQVVALEERLEASKADTEFLSGVLKDTEHRCSELQKAIDWREAAEEGWERAHNLHDLLVSRRALLRWGRNCCDRREGAKVEGAAAGLGDNLIKARYKLASIKQCSVAGCGDNLIKARYKLASIKQWSVAGCGDILVANLFGKTSMHEYI